MDREGKMQMSERKQTRDEYLHCQTIHVEETNADGTWTETEREWQNNFATRLQELRDN